MDSSVEFKILARRGDFSFGEDFIKLFAVQRSKGRISYAAKKLEFVQREACELIEPFLNIDADEAQGLMDSLWDCGLRPSEGSGSAGAMKAVQDHLADMKKILFHKMGIKE